MVKKKCSIIATFKDRKKKVEIPNVELSVAKKDVMEIKKLKKKGLYQNLKSIRIKC